MTMKEFLTNVSNGTITEEVIAKANEELVKIADKNEKRKTSEKALAKASENDEIRTVVASLLTDTVKPAKVLAEEAGKILGKTIETNTVTYVIKDIPNVKTVRDNYDGRKVNLYSI